MSIVEIPHESEVADITDNRARNACLTDSSCRASRPTNWVEISTLILVLAVLLIEGLAFAMARPGVAQVNTIEPENVAAELLPVVQQEFSPDRDVSNP